MIKTIAVIIFTGLLWNEDGTLSNVTTVPTATMEQCQRLKIVYAVNAMKKIDEVRGSFHIDCRIVTNDSEAIKVKYAP